jgi:3-phytase
MRAFAPFLISASLLCACATSGPAVSPTEDSYPAATVTAAFETPVMASEGDSADDPAIWIGADGSGFIAGTDKQTGLYVYELDGALRHHFEIGEVNNVDLRDGFAFGGRERVLLAMSDDETNAVELMLYDPLTDGFTRPEGSTQPVGTLSPYGICLGRGADGHHHVGVTTKSGRYEQFVVEAAGNALRMRKVRTFSTLMQTEGCAFDDRTQHLYLAQEEGDLLRYAADPSAGDAPTVIAKANDYGLLADLEGVTVYEDGSNGGYVLVSSQGNDSFAAFSLPDLAYAGRFRVGDGATDAVGGTDGIGVTSTPMSRFPRGFLVVQDDEDETSPSQRLKKQNFKVIDWRDIEAVLNAG